MFLQGTIRMSKLSSDRLNVTRKGHETVERAHSYFANIPEGVRHVLIVVASSRSKLEMLKYYGKAHWQSRRLWDPCSHPISTGQEYPTNQPIFTGKCVRSMEKEWWVTVWFDEGVQRIEVKIRENRRFTITDMAECFPNVSRKTVHRVVTEYLHFRKLCARWVPKNPTGGRLFRHWHSKTCDAIQQVPRCCWWLRRN
jgi:hypothetical protein